MRGRDSALYPIARGKASKIVIAHCCNDALQGYALCNAEFFLDSARINVYI
jgi:hypothetical protein